MKSEILQEAINYIDDDLFIENSSINKKKNAFGWIISAAGLAAAAAIIITVVPNANSKDTYPVKHLDACLSKETSEWTKETWNVSYDPCRYTNAETLNKKYTTCLVALKPENLGEEIGEAVMVGQDYFSLEIHKTSAKVYSIKGVSTDCAVGIRFHDEDEYAYSYMNTDYSPETLSNLLTDLDFKNKIFFGNAYETQGIDTIAFEGLSNDKVFELLFDDTEIKNEPYKEVGSTIMSISITSQTLGIDSIPKTLALTSDGYMWTNLLETGKYFYIGTEKIEAFKKYIYENCKGYIYKYDQITGDLYGQPE